MRRQLLILIVALAVLAGSLATAGAALRDRDETLRGYVDATRGSHLPYKLPRFGVNAELTQYSSEELARHLDLMRQAQATWVRQFFRWDEIEPQVGNFQWAQWDAIVQPFANDPQLRLVAVLVNTPAWAREGDVTTAPPTDPADFARFARAFAERYGTTIDHYQVWDEPNLHAAWGNNEPRPADYLALLRAAHNAIHSADSGATVLAAALAPTSETGPDNVSDIVYLRDLYALDAAPFMDAVAAKPYGFDTPPSYQAMRSDTLNFSRIVALREVMIQHGDGDKSLWASSWGWNALPDDWEGDPSIWGSATEDQRINYTLDALNRAEREFPWLGGMIIQNWQPAAPSDDPLWGFALIDGEGIPTALWATLAQRSTPAAASNGLYVPANTHARYSGVWTFGELGADIGWVQDSQLEFTFQGSDIALLVRQDNYVAFLYVTVDGQPANALPQDADGNAYVNLTSDTLEPEVELVMVARGLSAGEHTLHIMADRGWDRWALAGFAVSDGDLAAPYNQQIAIALLAAAISALAVLVTARRLDWMPLRLSTTAVWARLGNVGQIAVSVITSLALMIGLLLTWGDAIPNLFRREPIPVGLAILTTGLIFAQPHMILMLAALMLLFVIIYHRLDLGLTLTIFFAPFFLFPVDLYRFAFPMSELLILITGGAWTVRMLTALGRNRQSARHFARQASLRSLTSLDWGVAAWVLLGAVSLVWTQQRGIAITELRTLIVEPALFYVVLRTVARDRIPLLRLIDVLLIAGVIVALIGLFQFATGAAVITAEEGAGRLASVYGSPNNVALLLGRCIPFLLAFVLVRVDQRRRLLAAASLLIMLLAALLTQSAGSLLIGIPAAVAAVLLLVLGRRGMAAVAGLAGLGAFAIIAVALRSARFARLLNFSEGTNFFRLRVWQSAVEMIRDNPITGIGLDQFLYYYRGRYILPDAWQEPNLSHPHNIILDFWTRLGIFGVLLLLWIQAAFWQRSAALYRKLRDRDMLGFALVVGVMGSMINLLAHGLVDNSIFVNDLSYIFVLLLGIISNIRPIDANGEKVM